MASGTYTHTYTRIHTLADESDYKKPGMPACGRRAWFKNYIKAAVCSYVYDYSLIYADS